MADMNFVKVKQPTAMEICKAVELGEEARQLLQTAALPSEFLQQLLEKELYLDAVRFLATALPKREATWWACQCARNNCGETPSVTDLKAIELAEAWVYKPTAENRLPTMAAATKTDFKTAAGWAAIAAFWSGGNISPVQNATVEPAEDLFPKAVSGAVILAAVQDDADKIKSNYQLLLKKGIDIACGGTGKLV
ncbi:MAG: hypothetical protein HOP23_05115 [Methylococcaceae bacterium]|nr:hypothetical protein [Methylococcaceae bacterium]